MRCNVTLDIGQLRNQQVCVVALQSTVAKLQSKGSDEEFVSLLLTVIVRICSSDLPSSAFARTRSRIQTLLLNELMVVDGAAGLLMSSLEETREIMLDRTLFPESRQTCCEILLGRDTFHVLIINNASFDFNPCMDYWSCQLCLQSVLNCIESR